jgi:hypothetical protein
MQQRYEYKTVRLKVEKTFWGNPKPLEYHEIVDLYASEGWRLVQVFAPCIYGFGLAMFCDLIFERPVERD